MPSPTTRTLTLLEQEGYLAAIVERRKGPVTVDLFGFADVLGLRAWREVLLVQCTSGTNHSARVKKALALETMPALLAMGARCEVWSWRYSRRQGEWVVRRQKITMQDVGGEYGSHRENCSTR